MRILPLFESDFHKSDGIISDPVMNFITRA